MNEPMPERSDAPARIEALTRALAERDTRIATLESALDEMRAGIDAAPLTYFVFDRDGKFTAYEGGGVAAVGRVAGQLIGMPAAMYFASVPGSEEAMRAALAGERRVFTAGHTAQTFEVSLVPVFDASGSVRAVVGIAIDVSAREGAARALRVSDARFRAMIEKSASPICLADADGIVRYVSSGMRALLGRAPEHIVGTCFMDWVHEADREALARDREAGGDARGATHVFRMVHADGTVRWVESVSSDHVTDPDVGGFIASLRDVTDRRREEEAMRRRQAVMDRAQAIAHVGQWECAIGGGTSLRSQPITWSAECARIFGGDHASPPTLQAFFEQVHPDDRAQVMASSDAMFARGEPSITEHRMIRPDGAVRWMAAHAVLFRDESGRPMRIVGVTQDVTARRVAQDELLSAESRLRQAQKMEAIGNLAGGIAHDFNNLLSVIQSYAGVLLDELPPALDLRNDVDEIRRAAERAADLTRQLLAFSRKQLLAPRHVELDEIVSGMQRMLERLLGEHITLAWDGGASRSAVFADPGQIEQVIMNLVVNARDAMPNGGTLLIETSDAVVEEPIVSAHAEVPRGRYVKLSVGDTGIGMDAHVRAHLFEPFFTTKEVDRGTGLGLATVFGIVKQSGGHVAFRSAVGVGTTFDIYLPRSEGARATVTRTIIPPGSLEGHETILVVEDQDALRAILCTVLRRHGYRVHEAQNGVEALFVSDQLDERIDLLLTDVVMPRMNGTELARRLCEARPGLEVLFMSGFARSEADAREIAEGAYLEKPVTPMRVLRKVREVFARNGA